MSWNKWLVEFWNNNNYVNSDEARLDDATRPRDKFWFRLQPWRQMDKWDMKSSIKNYLPQVSAVWWKEITWANTLVDTMIPLWLWATALQWLPYTTYNTSLQAILWEWIWGYTEWNLPWKIDDKWWIIIPSAWSYLIEFYSEIYLDPNIWQTTCMITLFKWNEPRSRETKVNVSIPDFLSKITILDFKAWDTVYLWWTHASASWKKALYIWGITIFKLS